MHATKIPPITKENARELQTRSAESYRKNRSIVKAELLRLKTIERLWLLHKGNGFTDALLTRTREQCIGMLDIMDAERTKADPDGQRLNWLASALERMAELERVLAGRPTPGALRPSAAVARRAQSPGFTLEAPPDPTVPASPLQADLAPSNEQGNVSRDPLP